MDAQNKEAAQALELELFDEDILDALTHVSGYIDVSTEDFRTVYHLAWQHALARLQARHAAKAATPVPEPPGKGWRHYWRKMRGSTHGTPPRVSVREIAFSWLGAFLGIATLGWIGSVSFGSGDLALLIGSFGASAVLLFGAFRSPLAQPRNLLGGHLLSALTGVVCCKLFIATPWLAGAIAVASALALMHATRTLHPPGGGTALIAVIGSPEIHQMGFWYVLVPATLGPAIMLVIALLINNLPGSRRYPEAWL